MRTRRWILVIALFVAFTVLVIYHGWNLLKVNERIKQYVVFKIKPALGAEFQIQKLDMSLGAVHLKNVRVADNDFLLQIEDIRIGFNFTSLVKNGFNPKHIPHDILLIQPQLTLLRNPWEQSQQAVVDSSRSELQQVKYWNKLRDLDFIKRITVSKGKISFADSAHQQKTQLAQDINGWFNSKDPGIISARLVGKLFKSDAFNLLLTANINIAQQCLDLLEAKVTNYQWQEKIPLIIPDYFDIKRGTMDGVISLVSKHSNEKSNDIRGAFSINDGALQITDKGLYFDKINIKAKIEDQNCIFENSDCLFNGSPVEITGKITNIFAPQLDLSIKSDAFDVEKNIHRMAPKTKISLKGHSNLSFHITNSWNNPAITGQILSPQIIFNNKIFQKVVATISWEDSCFKITEFSSVLNGLEFLGYGKIGFSEKKDSVSFTITSLGEISSKLIKLPFPSLAKNSSQLQIHGKGDLSHVSGTVDFQFKTLSNLDTTFRFNGDFELGNKKLSLHLSSPSLQLLAEGSVFFSEKHPKYHFQLTDIHKLLYSLPELKIFQKIFNYKTSIIQLEGEQSDWRLNGKYAWKGTAYRTADMSGRIRSKNDELHISAGMDITSGGEIFHTGLNLIKTKEYWEIRDAEINDIFSGEGRIYLTGERLVNASVSFPGVSLAKLGKLLITNAEIINEGSLRGKISFDGTFENPEMAGSFDITNIMLNHIGLYDSDVNFQLVNKQFTLNEFNIKRNERQILKCDGTYQVDADQLNFDFHGNNIDLNSLATTIFNKPGILTGKGNSNIKLYGHLNRPNLCGNVAIENGKLGPFAFTRARLDLGREQISESFLDSLKSDSTEIHGIILNNIFISRAGQFEMQGSGEIPFSSQKPMQLSLQGKGNILSLLPELTPFFKETKSKGEWIANFTGSRLNDLTISSGRLDLSNGYLSLANVATEISNIAASMELEQDGFLNVKVISGKIKGKEFKIRNIRSDALSPDSTELSFSMPEYGLDLGVFTFETSPKGVALHIPGLMAKGEVGQFILSGKTDNEPFFIAGPFEQPVVKGKIKLQNINFTFPFIVNNATDTTKVDPVVDVLTHINWNISVVAGKDSHYQIKIPSGVDNVYVDLIVDVGVGGLEFKGIISDNSFGVTGSLESSRGNVEYLDLNFQVVKAGAEFDMDATPKAEVEFDKSSLLPIVYGEARTTVTDSTGYPYFVYLTLLTVDNETGHTLKRGRLGEVVFQLSSDNPNLGYSEGELLASLGYSISNMPKVATDLIGISTDNLIFRPLFRPVERQLERTLGLDMVRLSSRLARNLIEMNLNDEPNFQFDSRLFLLRSTKLMVGKYLAQRLFLLYTGQLEAGMHYRYQQEGFGFRHTLGLEYRINPSLLLQMEYDYDSLLLWQKEDKRIMLRHSFPF